MNLDALRVEGGFRIRGEAVTRLETFVDAAFAFAVTLLVVSFEAMPNSFAELYDALRRLPAFLAGFAIIAMFWAAHNRFSRRFGIEDWTVVVLSLALVAAALFYVYPLRMVMSAGMHHLTFGWAPSELKVSSTLEYRLVWVIYGSGFAVLAGLIALLNAHALKRADALTLDAAERAIARADIVAMTVLMSCAVLSVNIAMNLPERPGWQFGLPGFAYALLGIVLPIYGVRSRRRIDALVRLRDAASPPGEPAPAPESTPLPVPALTTLPPTAPPAVVSTTT